MIKKIKEKLNNMWNWIKKNTKKVLIAIGIIGVATVAGISQLPEKQIDIMVFDQPLYESVRQWKKPATDLEWAEDVKKESLDLKFDYQLDQMEQSLTEKLPTVQKDLQKFIDCPQCIKWELTERFKGEGYKGGKLTELVESEFQSQLSYYTLKTEKIQQSLERIEKEQDLRTKKVVSRKPVGTVYYIDADNGLDTNAGTHPINTPWKTLDKFTEAARTAGDKVIIRRGTATAISNGSDLTFTSSGTIVAPLQIEADYDNVWGDYANSAQTYTTVFGALTLTASANITGIAAGDWVYVTGDNAREFAYEVASVNGVTLTLYLPFKGTVGSGLTLVVMPDAPIWGAAAGDFQWNFDADKFWEVQGIDIRGTDTNGQVEIDSCFGHQFIDCIFIGDGTTSYGFNFTDDQVILRINKCRFGTNTYAIRINVGDAFGIVKIYNSLSAIDGVVIGGVGPTYINFELYDFETTAGTYAIFFNATNEGGSISSVKGRNVKLSGTTSLISLPAGKFGFMNFEDFQNVVGDNRQFSGLTTVTTDTPQIQSETGIVRESGAIKSIKVIPTTNIGTAWDFNRLLLFEIPIYLTTDQKTITIYFKTEATANWTADPLATELWIELEAWGHATNNYRKITKSTGVVDFNGSTAWQALTVTVAPAQAGVAYLRAYYAKTKEAQSNIFYVDPLPVIE